MRIVLRTVAVALFCAAPALAGITFTQTTTSQGGPDSAMSDTVVRASIEGASARLDFVETRNPMFGKGTYMLVGEKGMIFVDPAKQTFSRFDPAALLQGIDQMMTGMGNAGVKMEFKNPKVEKLLEEPGGEVAGYPTTHYRWHTTTTMVMKISGPMPLTSETETDMVEDVWTTTALDIPPATVAGLGNMVQGQLGGEAKKLADSAMSKMTGFALKRVMVSTSKGGVSQGPVSRRMGSHGPRTTTVEVKEVRKVDIPAAQFAVPAGYTETEMMRPGPAMPNLNQQPPGR